MKPCQMAPGGSCPHEATRTVRLDGIGDRAMCQAHAEWCVAQGFGRELDPNAFQPQWLRDGTFARDLTGRLGTVRS